MTFDNEGKKTKDVYSPSGKLVYTAYKCDKIVYSTKHIPEHSFSYNYTVNEIAFMTYGVFSYGYITQTEAVPYKVTYNIHIDTWGSGVSVPQNISIKFNAGETGRKSSGGQVHSGYYVQVDGQSGSITSIVLGD